MPSSYSFPSCSFLLSQSRFGPVGIAAMRLARHIFLFRFLLFWVALACALPVAPLRAAALATSPAETAGVSAIPPALGRVVYRQHAESPSQVYIVANSHRSAATGTNGAKTVQAQIETFRIGQWLIRHNRIARLLPEGFFGKEKRGDRAQETSEGLSAGALKAKLTDTTHFVNAELLLHRQFGIGLYQVENQNLYRQARKLLCTGLQNGTSLAPGFKDDLTYLQKRRLAAILQNIPAALETDSRQGLPAETNGMLTIGLAHLEDLIRFLRNRAIRIPAPSAGDPAFPPFQAPLLLRDLGVTVIVPRALLTERHLLQTAGLAPLANTRR